MTVGETGQQNCVTIRRSRHGSGRPGGGGEPVAVAAGAVEPVVVSKINSGHHENTHTASRTQQHRDADSETQRRTDGRSKGETSLPDAAMATRRQARPSWLDHGRLAEEDTTERLPDRHRVINTRPGRQTNSRTQTYTRTHGPVNPARSLISTTIKSGEHLQQPWIVRHKTT